MCDKYFVKTEVIFHKFNILFTNLIYYNYLVIIKYPFIYTIVIVLRSISSYWERYGKASSSYR